MEYAIAGIVGAGLFVGSNWTEVTGVSHYLIVFTVVVVLFVLGLYFIRRRTRVQAEEHHCVT